MIFTALKEKKTKLKVLVMADNDVTDVACDVIAETLQVNTTLVSMVTRLARKPYNSY